jgi:hypothetical protein
MAHKRAMTLRALAIAMAIAIPPGCKKPVNESVHLVAVGAREAIPAIHGPCRLPDVRPGAPAHFSPTGETFEAVDPGRVRMACERGIVVLDVRRPSRLGIDTTQVVKRGDLLVTRAQAFGAEGERLSIGEAPVSWSFSGALAPRPPPFCTLEASACPPGNAGFAKAYDDGEGGVVARFGALSARVVVTVLP